MNRNYLFNQDEDQGMEVMQPEVQKESVVLMENINSDNEYLDKILKDERTITDQEEVRRYKEFLENQANVEKEYLANQMNGEYNMDQNNELGDGEVMMKEPELFNGEEEE